MTDPDLVPLLNRIADALDRLVPPSRAAVDLGAANAFIWHAEREWLEPIAAVNRVDIDLLRGIDHVRDILLANTERFADGLPRPRALGSEGPGLGGDGLGWGGCQVLAPRGGENTPS
ncbi:MAG: DUF815 domain-containing protein [Stellaceae bacterium]